MSKTRILAAAIGMAIASTSALANEELAKKNDCTDCHAID